MKNQITINEHQLVIKEYQGQRVITFRDIDTVHEKSEGSARKRFNGNKKHFILGEDYFKVKCSEVRPFFGQTLPNGYSPNVDIILITESGYLMLVKSFTDDLAWRVQRNLVNSYFRLSNLQLKQDSYLIEDPATRARRWAEEYEERKALAERIEQDKPKVQFAEQVSDTTDLIDIGAYSKLLKKNGVKIGRNTLFEWLRNNGYLRPNNEPYQQYINQGYFKTKEYTYIVEGSPKIGIKTYVTGKGQHYLYNKLSTLGI